LNAPKPCNPIPPNCFACWAPPRYNADRTSAAIAAWKRAEELSPDSHTGYLLHKAERELEVEEKSRSKETSHFTLHYQGERTASEFHNQILESLENAYQDLSRQLNYTPGENIIVILYYTHKNSSRTSPKRRPGLAH